MPQNSLDFPDIRLDAQQRQVVAHERGGLRVLGAAGSGKTEALMAAVMAKLASSQESEGNDQRVLVLTYDKHSALALRAEFARRIGFGSMPLVRTFHSFALTLIRTFVRDEFDNYLRLLSAAEQDPRLRELLEHSVREGRVTLPTGYEEAMGTRGLAEEVRRLIAKAQQLNVGPNELERLGNAHEVPEWEAIAPFLDEYLSVIAGEGSVDYSGIFGQAERILRDNEGNPLLQFDAIYVDEYQDIEPAQVGFLRLLYGNSPAASLVIFGNPDQMIFRFKGARPESLAVADQELGHDVIGGDSAFATVTLSNQYRSSAAVLAAANKVVTRVPLARYPADLVKILRAGPHADDAQPLGDESCLAPVNVTSYLTHAAQEQGIADTIRELKLRNQVKRWADIAVIARSGSRTFPTLQQTLVAAGVPTTFVGNDVPLRDEPGVADILRVLNAAKPGTVIDEALAKDLALSPVGELTPTELRTLSRQLRDLSDGRGEQIRTAGRAFAQALLTPDLLTEVSSESAVKALKLAKLLEHVRTHFTQLSAHELLWDIWQWTNWPANLETAAQSQQSLGRAANRTLDAIVSLFEVPRRSERVDGTAMDAQQLLGELERQSFSPGDSATQGWRDSVQLLSAHSVKGRSWPAVLVVDLQEDSWPQVAQRASLLKTDQLGVAGYVEPLSMMDQIRDERRLLYTAMTRASELLYVTCVADSSLSQSGALPSRFFEELTEFAQEQARSGNPDFSVRQSQGPSARSLTTAALVADLRATLEDPEASAALKDAAANRLAVMKKAEVAAADPATWWGLRTWTDNETPVRPVDAPLKVSGSMWKNVDDCALRWFLQREAGGQTAGGTGAAFGSVVHALADAVASKEVQPDLNALEQYFELVRHRIGLDSSWQEESERQAAVQSLTRFLNWEDPAQRNSKLVATEQGFDATVQLDPEPGADDVRTQAQIRGFADRLEVDEEGATYVYDLKNEKYPPSQADVVEHEQLKLYQLAVDVGAFDGQPGVDVPHEVGGAALVQLRQPGASTDPKVQPQPAIPADEIKSELLAVIEQVRNEDFGATEFKHCDSCAFRIVCPLQLEGREVSG